VALAHGSRQSGFRRLAKDGKPESGISGKRVCPGSGNVIWRFLEDVDLTSGESAPGNRRGSETTAERLLRMTLHALRNSVVQAPVGVPFRVVLRLSLYRRHRRLTDSRHSYR